MVSSVNLLLFVYTPCTTSCGLRQISGSHLTSSQHDLIRSGEGGALKELCNIPEVGARHLPAFCWSILDRHWRCGSGCAGCSGCQHSCDGRFGFILNVILWLTFWPFSKTKINPWEKKRKEKKINKHWMRVRRSPQVKGVTSDPKKAFQQWTCLSAQHKL